MHFQIIKYKDMKPFKLLTVVTVMAGCLTLQGCLKEEVDFEDADGIVVTHFYTSPNTPLGEIANLYMYASGMNNRDSYVAIPPTNEADQPKFVEPDADWVSKRGLTVSYDTVMGRRVCRIHPRRGVTRYVFYLHGGYYTGNMQAVQYELVKPFVEELGYGVIIPDYPLCAAYTFRDAYAMVAAVYAQLVAEVGAGNIILMGDSAGGGLSFGFAQWLRENGGQQPGAIILISPWLDVTLTNDDIDLIDDPMLNRSYGQLVGSLWCADTTPRCYQVSPIYGDLGGLPRLHVFIGGRDMFYPDVTRLRDRMRRERLPLTVYEYPQMFHVWPALTMLPEAKKAQQQFIEIAKGI